MSSIFCAISSIKNLSRSDKICSGSAVYRTGTDDFVEYKFKAFRFSDTTLVEEIIKGNITMITIEQNTSLNIQTMDDFPTMYDLPVSPAFSIFTAPIQDPSTPEGDGAFFQLKREAYNSVTASQVSMPILCRYDPKGRHASVAEATKKNPIFSVAGELSSDKMLIKNRKTRNEELEKLAEKFDPVISRKLSRENRVETNHNPQEESSSRANKLRSAINDIKGNKNATTNTRVENQSETHSENQNKEQSHESNQTQTNESPTKCLYTRVDDCSDDQYTSNQEFDNENINNSEDIEPIVEEIQSVPKKSKKRKK
ncbi:hypothetical protein F8M41_012824 [Gigaspora margarita]|uniref:Uncharacterized protein n=1 Tax=Gigaspora margarita TaxID=4874 RepID=A0A8H4A0U5_GIGMA|nr:hypothetical protein F8M41_012824 [Gigaspora margarita]